jgi:hypothetical protein
MSDMVHTPEHEEELLGYAVEGAGDHAALAARLAACSDCLSYAVRVIEDLTALRARGRMDPAAAQPASVTRLDELLDDVMILLGPPEPPAGGQAEGSASDRRAVPVGGKRRP